MGDFATILANAFGITGTRPTKQRGYYLCNQGQTTLKIHKTNHSYKTLALEDQLLKQLTQHFPYTDWAATDKSPSVTLGRESYGIKKHIPGTEADFSQVADITAAMATLAHFHTKARGVTFTAPIKTGEDLLVRFEKHSQYLKKMAQEVGRKTKRSDFDMLFLKYVGGYIEDSHQSLQQLTATNYPQLYHQALAENHICHNNLKEENLPMYQGKCHMTNFVHFTADCQEVDVASLIYRYGRHGGGELTIQQLVDIYRHIHPHINPAMIKAYLLHPWKFIKVAKEYYSKKRAFIPGTIMAQMESIIHAKEGFEKYLQNFL